jgi:hypothetical protein
MYTGSFLPLCSVSFISEWSCVDCVTFNIFRKTVSKTQDFARWLALDARN